MNFVIGDEYDALEHSLEENIIILGRPLAEQIELLKSMPNDATVCLVTKVDKATGVITIESITPAESDTESR